MIFKIGDKDYPLTFGLDFLREMNKLHSTELEGMKTGYGAMTMLNVGTALNDPLAMVDIIKAATATEQQKPSNRDIELYINDLAVEGKFKETLNQITDEIKKSPTLMLAMNVQEA